MIMVKMINNNLFELIGTPYVINHDVPSIIPDIKKYLKHMACEGISTKTCYLSVAGEIINNKLNSATNISFTVDADEIKMHTTLSNITLLNDFKAVAEGINLYNLDQDVLKVNSYEEIKRNSNNYHVFQLALKNKYATSPKDCDKAVIGPGTGLG